ncbi:MAG: UDP-N-acetylglucosamine 2-epimerase (hydrolyzing) [Muribaculaceae bacterium]|nr:UDP-N-acetylglucosamine 2-epimerase (hydrolyzing) [Muribaculaceae bacterium]
MKRKVCIVTGTRAEWGLLSVIAQQLKLRQDVELQIVATNMHLDVRYGHTIDDIFAMGFEVNAQVPMKVEDDSRVSTAKAMAKCTEGMADAFAQLSPDVIVILGDRYEMLSVASVATVMRIPIIHLHGGEISEGAIDDSIRHAITKLSSLHLTATEQYRNRVIQMGESPKMVVNTGAIGVYNIANVAPMSLAELNDSLNFEITPGTLLVTYHPATLDDEDVEIRCIALLEALDEFPDNKVIITYPNNDAQGHVIIELIEAYASNNQDRVMVKPSLGLLRYISALHYVDAVVGNSSSGIIEVPSMGIPIVNIGMRQQGRMASESVIHCADDKDSIVEAIRYALSDVGREKAKSAQNPYCKENTLQLIVEAIATTPLGDLQRKTFYDLK